MTCGPLPSDNSDKRATFEKLARALCDVCDAAIDDGARPSMLLAALGATLSYVVARTDEAFDHAVERALYDMIDKIMHEAADARKYSTRRQSN